MNPSALAVIAHRALGRAPGPSPWCEGWASAGELDWRRSSIKHSGVIHGYAAGNRRLFELPSHTWQLGAAPGEISLLTQRACTVEVKTYRFDRGTRELPANESTDQEREPTAVRTTATVADAVSLQIGDQHEELQTAVRETPSLPEELAFPVSLLGIATRSSPACSLCVWRPREGRLRVIPLAWFNAGSIDIQYVGITRCARDAETGLILGEGVRIERFVVDDRGVRC